MPSDPSDMSGAEEVLEAKPSALFVSDLHVPLHDPAMIARALHILRTQHPSVDRIVIGGDLFNFSSLSKHPQTSPDEDLDRTLEIAGNVICVMADSAKHIDIVMGNHDEWFMKRLNKKFNLKHLISAALGDHWPTTCKIRVSNYDYMRLGNWLVGHPSSYSKLGGRKPAETAQARNANIITGHNHLVGMQQSVDGRHIGIDAGMMTIEDKHYYAKRRLGTSPTWVAGFVVLEDGYPYIYNDLVTDWRGYGC